MLTRMERADLELLVTRAATEAAEKASKETVSEIFKALGVDISKPLEVQRDFAALRNWRVSSETVKRQALISAIGVLTVGLLGMIYQHFMMKG